MLEERKQEILNPSEPHGVNLETSHQDDLEQGDKLRSETDKDKAQDTAALPPQRLNETEYHARNQTQYETKIQSAEHQAQTENVAKSEGKTENTSVARQQDTWGAQTAELPQSNIQKSETEGSQKLGGQNNAGRFSAACGGQNIGSHFSPATSSGSRNNVNTPSSPPAASSGLRHVRNEEQRAYNRLLLKAATILKSSSSGLLRKRSRQSSRWTWGGRRTPGWSSMGTLS